jgi:hypothetical protein
VSFVSGSRPENVPRYRPVTVATGSVPMERLHHVLVLVPEFFEILL